MVVTVVAVEIHTTMSQWNLLCKALYMVEAGSGPMIRKLATVILSCFWLQYNVHTLRAKQSAVFVHYKNSVHCTKWLCAWKRGKRRSSGNKLLIGTYL